PGIFRFECSDACRINAAHLASPYTDGHVIAAKHNGVGFDKLGHGPRKEQVIHLLGGGLSLSHYLKEAVIISTCVGCLSQPSTPDAFELKVIVASTQGQAQYTHVFFLSQHLQSLGAVIRSK